MSDERRWPRLLIVFRPAFGDSEEWKRGAKADRTCGKCGLLFGWVGAMQSHRHGCRADVGRSCHHE